MFQKEESNKEENGFFSDKLLFCKDTCGVIGGMGGRGVPLGPQQVLESILIVPALRTVSFIQAWSEWIEYRIEIGRQHRWVTTVRCFQKCMNKCKLWGPDRAIAAIDYSIEMGYRGLFEPRNFENARITRDALGRNLTPFNPETYKPGSML